MNSDSAELLASRLLEWLASDPDLIGRFLGETGLGLSDVNGSLAQPEGLAAVVDHIMGQDALVMRAAEDLGVPPDSFVTLRAALPGGDLPHWT